MNRALRRKLATDSAGNLCTVPPATGLPIKRFLTEAGDGTGTYNLNGNYSASPVTIYYEAVKRFELKSLLINISTAAKINQTDYGDITVGTVTNGVRFYIQPVGYSDISILTDIGVTKNYEWSLITPNFYPTSFDGTAQTLIINIKVEEEYGSLLHMLPGDKLKVILNDNFTGLVNHSFGIRGTQFEI